MVLHALIQLVNVEEDGTPFLELTFCHRRCSSSRNSLRSNANSTLCSKSHKAKYSHTIHIGMIALLLLSSVINVNSVSRVISVGSESSVRNVNSF